MIRNLWKKIVAFLKKIFNRDQAIENTLKKQKEQVDQLPDSNNYPKTLDGIAKEDMGHMEIFMDQIPFGINGKCDHETAQTILENTETLLRANREIVLEIVECMKSLTQDNINYPKVIDEVENLVNDMKSNISRLPLNFKKTVDAVITYSYGHLVSEKSCVIYEQRGRNDEPDKVFNLEIDIQSKGQRSPYIPETLGKKQMSQLLVSAIRLTEQIKAFDKVVEIVDKVLQRTTLYLTQQIEKQSHENQKNIRLVLSLIKDLFRYISTMLPKVSRDASQVSATLTYYVKTSMSLYPH